MAPQTPSRGPAASLQGLAQRAARGDEDAFEALHRRLAGGLRRFLLKRLAGDADNAEELAQRTWVEVWRALRAGRYDPRRAAITTFIYAVAYKLWLRQRRAAAGRPGSRTGGRLGDGPVRRIGDPPAAGLVPEALESVAAGETAHVDDPANALHFSELLEALRACLNAGGTANALTDEERCIIAGCAQGESERSLGASLGLAASTINARKRSAYQKLRKCLAEKGFSLGDSGEPPAGEGPASAGGPAHPRGSGRTRGPAPSAGSGSGRSYERPPPEGE